MLEAHSSFARGRRLRGAGELSFAIQPATHRGFVVDVVVAMGSDAEIRSPDLGGFM